MNRLDVYYRALRQYRKEVEAKRQCKAENHAVATSDIRLDQIVFERKKCDIDRTWIDEIEKGLVFVEKAIKEERQFIRSNGEVVPIEKVKSVSKTSVEHLARHSNLITRVREDEDIIPDKLYTVEKLSDFAVYENRFLYMLLCYLRDFVTLRYNKILDVSNTYNASMAMSKSVKTEKETVIYKVELSDTRKDDEYLTANNSAQELIDRIDLLLKTISAFLSTPLMEMVAKAPMLKPPITKTNVLKMNNNFKGAMALYAFVTSYEGDGYTIESETKLITPFEPEFADEMANTVTLASFLTYKRALGIEAELAESYAVEEQKRKDEELQKRLDKIENLKRRLKNKEITAEEYIIDVEKALREYEKRLRDFNKTSLKLQDTETNLAEACKREKNLEDQNHQYIIELQEQRTAYEKRIEEINASHIEECARLKFEYEEKKEKELAEQESSYESKLLDKESEIAEMKASHKSEISALKSELANGNSEIEKQRKLIDEITEERRITQAKLLGLKTKTGNVQEDDSYITEERFDELEKMLASFKRFYKEEWVKAKKKIRRDFLWKKKNGEQDLTKPENKNEKEPESAEKLKLKPEKKADLLKAVPEEDAITENAANSESTEAENTTVENTSASAEDTASAEAKNASATSISEEINKDDISSGDDNMLTKEIANVNSSEQTEHSSSNEPISSNV